MDKKGIHVTRKYERKMPEISPLELKNILIKLVGESARESTCVTLNVGRGNPNWISTVPREASFLSGQFALGGCQRETELTDETAGATGIPNRKRITSRFVQFLKKHAQPPSAISLKGTYEYLVTEKGIGENELIYEWAEGIIGGQYPVPDRILEYTEMLVRDHLDQELCDNRPPGGVLDLFATEGRTVVMCYTFDSSQQNFLLNKGDKIVLFAPIFTPYIEISEQARYLFNAIEIKALKMTKDGYHTWQYQEEDLDVLKDLSVKVAFTTNPSNPPSYGLTKALMNKIVEIVRNDNPDLMTITDDAYATFIPHFRSMMAELPKGTLRVYPFSRYFRATGWRLVIIALHRDNTYDRMVRELPRDKQELLKKQYNSLSLHPEDIRFIDRMVADNHQVVLNHTAGLSLPQRTQMSLFTSFALLGAENIYKKRVRDMIHEHLYALWESIGFTLLDDPLRAEYCSEIDTPAWAEKLYGGDSVEYLKKNYRPLDVVFRLTQETSLASLDEGSFDAPGWSIHVSLADLKREDYVRIGKGIVPILHSYTQGWKGSLSK